MLATYLVSFLRLIAEKQGVLDDSASLQQRHAGPH